MTHKSCTHRRRKITCASKHAWVAALVPIHNVFLDAFPRSQPQFNWIAIVLVPRTKKWCVVEIFRIEKHSMSMHQIGIHATTITTTRAVEKARATRIKKNILTCWRYKVLFLLLLLLADGSGNNNFLIGIPQNNNDKLNEFLLLPPPPHTQPALLLLSRYYHLLSLK